jgi:hypothetical protein
MPAFDPDMLDHHEPTQSCDECELLTRRWIAATEQLGRSVAELTGKMGTVPKPVYESLFRTAEESRWLVQVAENALTSHRKVHHRVPLGRMPASD